MHNNITVELDKGHSEIYNEPPYKGHLSHYTLVRLLPLDKDRVPIQRGSYITIVIPDITKCWTLETSFPSATLAAFLTVLERESWILIHWLISML